MIAAVASPGSGRGAAAYVLDLIPVENPVAIGVVVCGISPETEHLIVVADAIVVAVAICGIWIGMNEFLPVPNSVAVSVLNGRICSESDLSCGRESVGVGVVVEVALEGAEPTQFIVIVDAVAVGIVFEGTLEGELQRKLRLVFNGGHERF
jgi:hypothetical protein